MKLNEITLISNIQGKWFILKVKYTEPSKQNHYPIHNDLKQWIQVKRTDIIRGLEKTIQKTKTWFQSTLAFHSVLREIRDYMNNNNNNENNAKGVEK